MSGLSTHRAYLDGPPCNEGCPGEWSTYHEGYADGYESALRSEPDEELRALSEAATPGPWMAQTTSDGAGLLCGPDHGGLDVGGAIGFLESDAAFIAAAVNYVRAALAAKEPTDD